MAYPDNLLVQGERVIVNKRPHWKVLILPTILFIVIIAAGVALATWISKSNWDNPQWAYYAIIGVALVALIILVLVPFVRWRTEHFVITNHHVFFRTGLLSRREHQIPLGQIANMETEVTFWGRLMGYGSLIVESSADQPLKFRNVASLSKVQAQLNQLIRDERERTHRGPDRGPGSDSGSFPQQGYQQPQGYPQQYVAPQQDYGQPGYPTAGQQGYPQQGYPPPGQAPQGYQPTQAYQQPPGYPPPGYPSPGYQSPGYPSSGYAAPTPDPSGQPTIAGPPASPTPAQSPPAGSAQGEGRPTQQS
jgi:membrane protein YdbS with pleckstrin-like domain